MEATPSVERIWERCGRISKFVMIADEEFNIEFTHERVRKWHNAETLPPIFILPLLAQVSEYPLEVVVKAYVELQLKKMKAN